MSAQDINQSGIVPTGGHLLVVPEKVEEVTKAGIILINQENEQRAVTVGVLIAIGPGAWLDLDDGSPWAKVGDKICYAKHAGFPMVGKDDEPCLLINDNDVLAKLLF